MENKRLFFITMDVEEDLGCDTRNPKEFDGITKGIPIFLDLLDTLNIAATFFITGEIGTKFPDVVHQIGKFHEVSCHGLFHKVVTSYSMDDNRKFLIQNVQIMEKITGHKPLGFRAVNNVVNSQFINLLDELHFKYDSSIINNYPLFKAYKGFEGRSAKSPYHPCRTDCRKRGDCEIVEMPISTIPLINFPWGGTWIRTFGTLPYWLSTSFSGPSYIMLAVHSWDFINIKGKTTFSRNSGVKLAKMLHKFLLAISKKGYTFCTLSDGLRLYE